MKVMVAIDESECSYYALEWALQNLKETIASSELVVFCVQNLANLGYVYASSFGAAPAELIQNLEQNQKKFVLSLLEKAKEICSKHGIEAETLTEVGDPKEAICEAVEKLNVQLLVLGSRSRGAIQRLFILPFSFLSALSCFL
ncbi:hypothetical protein CRG98_019216 [Punica granatum]|uniref:UspA domain-containing protein n=1 Tax=Punica granatum TaxID=22663 RepID=A0A2I0JVS0_PUNGR|nr:hypothetical protein CRG98_019216 [Punica granatum]